MPPPTRPFTTSSLTSTLRSTIASQPLLSNLTSIDKLSSQASSLAQKTPFFNNIANNISGNSASSSSTGCNINRSNLQQQQSHQANLQHDANLGQHQPQNSQTANMMMRNQAGSINATSASGQGANSNQPKPPMANTPAVDMSHLTEEERLMIQSVMAKAEMADMGIPVDTSVPSSTNLPSNTSQLLSQQTKHNIHSQQQNMIQQQHQQQAVNQQQQQQLQQQQQQQQQQLQLQHQQELQHQQHLNQQNISPMINQQQQQQRHQDPMSSRQLDLQQMPTCSMNDANMIQVSSNMVDQRMNQLQFSRQNQQTYAQQTDHHSNPMMFNNSSAINNQTLIEPKSSLALLQQQTQQTVADINAQFNLSQAQDTQQISNTPEVQNFNQSIGRQHDMTNQLASQNIANQHLQQQQHHVPMNSLQQVNQQISSDQSMQSMQNNQMMMNQNGVVPNPQQMLNPPYQQTQGQPGSMIYDHTQIMQASPTQPHFGPRDIKPTNMGCVQGPSQAVQHSTNSQGINFGDYRQTQLTSQSITNPPTLAVQQHVSGGINSLTSHNESIISERQEANHQVSLHSQGRNFDELGFRSAPTNQPTGQEAYQNSRSQIRFGHKVNSYDEQALSDQEFHRGSTRRYHDSESLTRQRDPVDQSDDFSMRYLQSSDQHAKRQAEERSIQAYDLAHRNHSNSPRPAKSRQLPQPTQHDLRSSNDRNHEDRISRRIREDRISGSTINKSRDVKLNSSKNLSYSDEDERENTSQVDRETFRKSPTPSSTRDTIDKSEEALRLITELKLTEQANQVMEQQQLLIKQSQELIKLQLEQQALSQELKKSIKQTDSEVKDDQVEPAEKDIKKPVDPEAHLDQVAQQDEKDDSLTSGRNSLQRTSDSSKVAVSEDRANRREKLVQSKKSASICEDIESDLDDSIRSSNRPSSKAKEARSDLYAGSDSERRSRSSQKHFNEKRTHANLSSSASQTDPGQRYNRELLHSPTDTTDSDVEPLGRSNLRRQHRLDQTRQKGVIRRREPTGLPPSPLPVAAAIQLHQMQQQHYRQIGSKSIAAKTNFSSARSRSVTSSPGHHLDHLNSGYLTDNQRIRSTSPDTWSEYGGLRRRKRLPEPPTNLVPLTPSMVRKMIQSQRAGTSSSKLLTSVNAQSTLMTNTHSNRNVAFEKHSDIRSVQGSLQSETSNTKQTSTQKNPLSEAEVQESENVVGRSSDLNKFLSSTYGNSILKGSISEVRETPELDKIISNLDDYYGLDHKRQPRVQRTLNYGPSNQSSVLTNQPVLSSSLISSPLKSTWQSSRLNQSDPPSLLRCNSEGEENLAARLARRSYRQPYMSDHLSESKLLKSSYPGYRSTLSSASNSQSSGNRHHTPTALYLEGAQETCPKINEFTTLTPNRYDWALRNYQLPTSSTQMTPRTNFLSTSTGARDILDFPSFQTQLPEHKPYSSTYTDYTNSSYARHLATSPVVNPSCASYKYPTSRGYSKGYDKVEMIVDANRFQSGIARNDDITSTGHRRALDHQRSLDYDFRQQYYGNQRGRLNVTNSESGVIESSYNQVRPSHVTVDSAANSNPLGHSNYNVPVQSSYMESFSGNNSGKTFAPLTKDDIINNGPKFDSIGYRFHTENQYKYVAHARAPIQSYQIRYPPPYKRISLSKNPKDRIGNGIGMKITGGQPIPSLYDKVNRCIVTSGAFVTEVFQNSNVYFMDEIHEGDQIIEWNGVNLCNRSDEEIQQILLSQLSDDEVEIVYLPIDKFYTAYGTPDREYLDINLQNKSGEQDTFDTFSRINRGGHSFADPMRDRYAEANKGSVRRRLSLSSIAHMWSK